IDHHPNNDNYGDFNWVDTEASSTSELIYELASHNETLQMTDEAARLIYSGTIGDTGRLLFPSTSPKTFHYAAELVKYNFDRTALYNRLYDVPDKIARMRGYILQNYELSESGAVSVKVTQEILDKFDVDSTETAGLVGILGDIQGVKAWIIFIEEDYLIRASISSIETEINTLANKYNCGGHPLASDASVSSWEEAEVLETDLEVLCESYR